MNIYQINCFVTVCRFMSFTKAANQLFISQQGISKIVNRIETELQVSLFTRKNANLELTDCGKLFLNSSLIILREYNSVTEQLNLMKCQKDIVMNIYLPMGMMGIFPMDELNLFRESHQNVNINLHQATDVECEDALINGKADIAFCALPLSSELFTIHKKKSHPVYFLMSKKNPLAKSKYLTVNDLQNTRFITIDADNKSGNAFIERCEKSGFKPNVSMRSSNTQLIYELCQKDAGVSFYVGNPKNVPKELAIVPEEPQNTWDVALVTLSYRNQSPIVEEFIKSFLQW